MLAYTFRSRQATPFLGSALISILLFSVVLFAVSSLTFYYVLRNTTIHSTLSRMADPSKPDEPKPTPQRKSIARDALDELEEKTRQNTREVVERLGTIDPKADPDAKPRTEDEAWAPLMDSPELQDFAKDYEEKRRATTRILGATGRMPEREPESPYSLASWVTHGDPDRRRKDEEELLRKREELIEREEKLQYDPSRAYASAFKDLDNEPSQAPPRSRYQGLFNEPQESPAKSLWDKFWKLTESNLLWGGGVGMALVALGFRWGNAPPKFTIALLVLAWLIFSISVYRHRFFEGRKRRWEIAGNVVISLIIAVTLTVLWLLLQPSVSIPVLQPALSQLPQPSPSPSLKPNPSPSVATAVETTPAPSPAHPSPITPSSFPNDVKLGLLQCNVSVYEEPSGYRTLKEAVCIAKHQQTGQEFVGTVGAESVANINLPYGFYIVTIKAEGYITRVEAVKVEGEVTSVGVVLQKGK
jgi:hypothetical protein